MVNNFRVLTVLLSVMFVAVSCDDSLDEVQQDIQIVKRERLLEKVQILTKEAIKQVYTFTYDKDNILSSFSIPDSEPISLEYDDDGTLSNFEKVVDDIFFSDLIFKNPYSSEFESFELLVKDRDKKTNNPTVVKMILVATDKTVKDIDVEIKYDNSANIYRPYLRAGGIVEAAEQHSSMEGRVVYFTNGFLPINNPISIMFKTKEGKLERMYSVQYKYDDKLRVTESVVTYFDMTTEKTPAPVVTTVLYDYLKEIEN